MERKINSRFVFIKSDGKKHLCRIVNNSTPDSCESCFLDYAECDVNIVGYCSKDTRKDERDVCVKLIRSQKN